MLKTGAARETFIKRYTFLVSCSLTPWRIASESLSICRRIREKKTRVVDDAHLHTRLFVYRGAPDMPPAAAGTMT